MTRCGYPVRDHVANQAEVYTMLGDAAPAAGRHDVGSRVDRTAGAKACTEQLVTRRVVEMKGDGRPDSGRYTPTCRYG